MITLSGIRLFWLECFCDFELIGQLLLFPLMAILSVALLPIAILELVLIDPTALVVFAATGVLKDFFEIYWGMNENSRNIAMLLR